jgi:hypothetical protein
MAPSMASTWKSAGYAAHIIGRLSSDDGATTGLKGRERIGMIVISPAVEIIPSGRLKRCAGNFKRFGTGRRSCVRAHFKAVGPFKPCMVSRALSLALLRRCGRDIGLLW